MKRMYVPCLIAVFLAGGIAAFQGSASPLPTGNFVRAEKDTVPDRIRAVDMSMERQMEDGINFAMSDVRNELALDELSIFASSDKLSEEQRLKELRMIFDQMSALSNIPWYWFAAVNQYDRTINAVVRSRKPLNDQLINIYYSDSEWAGALNPDKEDTNPLSISLFGGVGMDGNNDGRADRSDPLDVIYTFTRHLLRYGIQPNRLKVALWEHYHNPRSVERIEQFARLYETFGTLDLGKRAFPVPVRANYSYRSTWGAARGWGGRRIHEGTDIFANYGTPVRSTCYGIIEVMGWNKYGGWRVGIRDIYNVYHYFAHLSGFNKELKVGDIVEPGQTIGWVGSSGYGKPGTQGKFPPHLHFGMYRDNGLSEWSFDPYPYLKRWEREERTKR